MTVQIGRVALPESEIRPVDESWSADGRTVTLSGIMFSGASYSVARMTAIHDDLLGLPESLVPVVFDGKTHRSGYYTVLGSKSVLTHLTGQQIVQVVWSVDLRREGGANEVDLEARLAGPVNRLNDHTLSGERWLALPIGSSALWIGATSPGTVSRTSYEGVIPVYRSIAEANSVARWYTPVTEYKMGRARIFNGGFERQGIAVSLTPNECWLDNALLEVQPRTGGIAVRAWDSGSFQSKDIDLMVNGNALPLPLAIAVLHNQYERVTIRCLWSVTAVGRVIADLTLRRGSRFVELLMRSAVATTLGVRRTQTEAGTAGSGFVRASSNDASGNRYVIGSSRTFTGDFTQGGLSRAATTRLDAFIGAELDGTSAVAGDTGEHMMAQYLGSPSQTVVAVRR